MESFSETKSRQFYEAARKGNLPQVQALSLDPEVNLHWTVPESPRFNPFLKVCENGHVEVIRYLLDFKERPIDYNFPDENHFTPFMTACFRGERKVVKMLLEDGRIDVNRPNLFGQNPLWIASREGHLGVVELLLASGREIEGEEGAADIAGAIFQGPLESDEAFQAKKARGEKIAKLLGWFEKNPQKIRGLLRQALGYPDQGVNAQ